MTEMLWQQLKRAVHKQITSKPQNPKFLHNNVKDGSYRQSLLQVTAAKGGSPAFGSLDVLIFSQDCKESCENFAFLLSLYMTV